jgi:hypothetical protein
LCVLLYSTANTSVFGYPSEGEALAYCQAFRMSLVAITCMCFSVHGIAVACAICVRYNVTEGRASLEHEVYDFDAATAFHDVASARSSFAAAVGVPPVTPKPLLSRANTNTGSPVPNTTDSGHNSPQIPSIYTANPMK